METYEKVREELNFELVVVLKKRTEHICLIPRLSVVNPFSRIFEGIENVVKVNIDTRLQCGQDDREKIIHIATDFRDVCGINEKKIAAGQPRKFLNGN